MATPAQVQASRIHNAVSKYKASEKRREIERVLEHLSEVAEGDQQHRDLCPLVDEIAELRPDGRAPTFAELMALSRELDAAIEGLVEIAHANDKRAQQNRIDVSINGPQPKPAQSVQHEAADLEDTLADEGPQGEAQRRIERLTDVVTVPLARIIQDEAENGDNDHPEGIANAAARRIVQHIYL